MLNAMSIDLEDWFCVNNFAGIIPRSQWPECELRVTESTRTILKLLKARDTLGTFFVLGWVADRVPSLIREIADQGHEIGTHGYSHALVTTLSPEEFEKDLQRSIDTIARCTGEYPTGFRAPSFSITRATTWALPILRRNGILYDSSVFPIGFHPDYGIGDAPLVPHEFHEVLEIPMTCVEVMGARIPCCGGGYFRLFPYAMTRQLMERCNREGRSVVFYTHPWEFDPEQPRVRTSRLKTFRHYRNLHKTADRFARMLDQFEFAPIKQTLLQHERHAEGVSLPQLPAWGRAADLSAVRADVS